MKTLLTLFFLTLFYSENLHAQTSLNSQDSIEKSDKDLVFTKVETEASFPGGPAAWQSYIADYIQRSNIKNKESETCVVKFIVDKDGNISEAKAITMQGSKLAKTAINAIKDSPQWIPAQQNGISVNAWRIQPVTAKSPQKKKKRYFATGPSSSYVTVVDIKKNTVPRAYHKILMFGAGNSLVRLVIDKLDEQLEPELKNNKIESNYYFLGNDKDMATEKSEQIFKTEKCDAIMVFMQASDSYIKETTFIEGLPLRDIRGSQTVAVQLFDVNDKDHAIWEAIIDMNFNLTSNKAYKQISEQILKNMRENMILN